MSVKDGSITLKGSVESRDVKREAERCVENLRGVSDVQNEIRVKQKENGLRANQENNQTANLS